MTVAFNNMPANVLTSLYFGEFNAGASPYSSTSRQVLVAHAIAGFPTYGSVIDIGGSNPNSLFGFGSMAADMALFARQGDPLGSITVLLAPEPTGVKAAETVTFVGTATQAGTFTRYIAGIAFSCSVAAGDTPTIIAGNWAAAVNAGYTQFNIKMGAPVVASPAAAVVTLTARHLGSYGNTIRVESGLQGESDPAGVTITQSGTAVVGTLNGAATLTGGTGEVDLAAALALLGGLNAEWIASPFATTAQLNVTQSYLANSGSGRWAPTVQKGGHYITAAPFTLATATTFGTGRNDAHASIFPLRNMPAAPWVFAAAVNGIVARSKNMAASLSEATEIARPLQTIVVPGILAPYSPADHWQRADRETLYRNGMAAYTVTASRQVMLERVPTTNQINPFGNPDVTWLDIETLAISQYVGRYNRQRIESLYPRCVLVDDNPNNNQGVVTPAQARAAQVHAYYELYGASLVQRPDLFAKYLITERAGDRNRLNNFLPIGVANQLRVFAVNATIYLNLTDNLVAG